MFKKEKKDEEIKKFWLSAGTLKNGFPECALKLSKPLLKGSYVLAKLPDGRKEVFILTKIPYRIPFDIEGIPVVLRKATFKEIKDYEKKLEIEEKGKELCLQFAKDFGIEMNLVRVDCFFDRSKIIFYYTAEERIDFRELVKALAKALKIRIEMRQIAVRNETALIGGIGYCGREFCCSTFLKQFTPLSIKMIREQGLILDPNKISGPCERLLCCLAYENDLYKEFLKDLPKLGSKIKVNEMSYKVLKYNIFQNIVYLENEKKEIIKAPVTEIKTFIEENTKEDLEEEFKNLEER